MESLKGLIALLLATPVIAAQNISSMGSPAHGAASGGIATSIADRPRGDVWLPDEPVQTIAIDGDVLYLGGRFQQVGPVTGPFADLSAASGEARRNWPKFDGRIYSVEGDGLGGWFVGGDFLRAGAASRHNLAHVTAWGTVSPFDADVQGPVRALERAGPTLYLGGDFSDVGGQPRERMAAVDAGTGALLSWDPNVGGNWSSSEDVFCLLADDSVVYVGGFFDDTLGGVPRRNLAAVDALSGAVLAFDPSPNSSVWDLLVSGPILYVAGNFGSISGAARGRVAGIHKVTGAPTAFDPVASSTVKALALKGDTLYMGGLFTTMSGQPRSCVAASSVATSTLLPWNPSAALDDGGGLAVDDLAVSGLHVYVAGSFRLIGGERKLSIAMVDAVDGLAQPWVGDAAGPAATWVHALALQDTRLGAGGEFSTMGGERRVAAAAIDLSTGELNAWQPLLYGISGPPSVGTAIDIVADGDTVYVGGSFNFVNGTPREHLVATDAATGNLLPGFDAGPFHPSSDSVQRLALRDGVLFAYGTFDKAASTMTNLGAFDALTGLPVPGWSGSASQVRDLQMSEDGSQLLVAGGFGSIGLPPASRDGLAAVDPSSGSLLPWNPTQDRDVDALLQKGGRVFVGGDFNTVGGVLHRAAARVSLATGASDSWDLGITGVGQPSVSAFARRGDTLFLAGDFTTFSGGEWRPGLAAVSISRRAVLAWDTKAPNGVEHLAVNAGSLVVAGSFSAISGINRPYLAVFRLR